ncbi:hypothetical protein HID58_067731 [Brassica napus]|uniref:RRM domain-containing protein n=1 Tax=Brassica napus TaxID=3708 RepID=A0ABQ7ZJC3_BRANA|nr:hypothetical protein HID58_067731 [Brassica napus]
MQTTNGSDSTSATPPANQTTPPPPQQWQQHQQWMMQYPGAAAMMMMQHQQQHMMMYPHQYLPYNHGGHYHHHPPHLQYAPYHQQHHNHHQKTHERGGSGEDVKTLWVGDLLHWMDETYLHTCFSHTGEWLVDMEQMVSLLMGHSLMVIQTTQQKSADDAIQSLNGTVIGKNTVRLSWGRTPNKQWRGDNGGYSRGQGYNNGGYANHHDSNTYPAET